MVAKVTIHHITMILLSIFLTSVVYNTAGASILCKEILSKPQQVTGKHLSAEQKKMMVKFADFADMSPNGSHAVLSIPDPSLSDMIFEEFAAHLHSFGVNADMIIRAKPSTQEELINLFVSIRNNKFSAPDKVLWIEAPFIANENVNYDYELAIRTGPSLAYSKGPWFDAWMKSYNMLNCFGDGGPAIPFHFMLMITPKHVNGFDLRTAAIDFHTKTTYSTILPE